MSVISHNLALASPVRLHAHPPSLLPTCVRPHLSVCDPVHALACLLTCKPPQARAHPCMPLHTHARPCSHAHAICTCVLVHVWVRVWCECDVHACVLVLMGVLGGMDEQFCMYEHGSVMHHVHGSMRRNALSSDLEPGARRGGVADRQAGGMATHAPQPQPQPLHTTILTFQRPHALASSSDRPQNWYEYRARLVRRIPSESGHSGALISFNHTKISLAHLKTPKACAGNSASNKRRPQWGLVPPSRPCHVGRRPTSRVASQGPGVST